MNALRCTLLSCSFVVALAGPTVGATAVPAFPGAEGFGAATAGGRGGRVLEVTSLSDGGPGSLRDALEAAGPRVVVFRVAGVITLNRPLTVSHPYLTVAGQSAPGDGICVRGDTITIDASDIVLRYLRFRRGNLTSRDDALNGRHSPGRIIVDHCSFSWGLDENVSFYRYMKPVAGAPDEKNPIEGLTIQWCIISEALNANKHAFGATWGGRGASFHHNLFASNTARNPSIGFGNLVDLRNNVLFNWQHRTIDGGDATSRVNVVANYFKPGPATQSGPVSYRVAKPDPQRNFLENPDLGRWHVADNLVEGNSAVTADNWAGGVQFEEGSPERAAELAAFVERSKQAPAHPAPFISQQPAAAAFERVLDDAGATKPRRDAVDDRVVREARSGKPAQGNGIINTPDDVGGWPVYAGVPAPVDSDHDGMPDAWERANGLNPGAPADGIADADKDGYTNLEEFLNGTHPRQFVDYTKPENNVNTL